MIARVPAALGALRYRGRHHRPALLRRLLHAATARFHPGGVFRQRGVSGLYGALDSATGARAVPVPPPGAADLMPGSSAPWGSRNSVQEALSGAAGARLAIALRRGIPSTTRAAGGASRIGAGGGDRGAFTVEFAAALPALVLLLMVGLTAVRGAADQGRCYDAARDAALAAARGEPGADVGAAAAPPGATITLHIDGDQVRAVVSAPVRALGRGLSTVRVTGEAVAVIEPGVSVVGE